MRVGPVIVTAGYLRAEVAALAHFSFNQGHAAGRREAEAEHAGYVQGLYAGASLLAEGYEQVRVSRQHPTMIWWLSVRP